MGPLAPGGASGAPYDGRVPRIQVVGDAVKRDATPLQRRRGAVGDKRRAAHDPRRGVLFVLIRRTDGGTYGASGFHHPYMLWLRSVRRSLRASPAQAHKAGNDDGRSCGHVDTS